MRWLRFVGSLKLYVSFVKRPYKRDYILQKRHLMLRSLLIAATPYDTYMSDTHIYKSDMTYVLVIRHIYE